MQECSLIISTYNWPEALRLTLMSVQRQTIAPSEIIIADDGSNQSTKNLIDLFRTKLRIPIIHIWHEDKGFRLAAIRNKSFAHSKYKYIIQVDGDVILHHNFIKDHLLASRRGYLLQGSRALLGETYSQKLLEHQSIDINRLHPDIRRRENAIRIPSLSKLLLDKYKNRFPVYYARGANMSFWKEDLVNVNGYDENFEGWGHEDSDLTLRLMNNGIKKRIIKFAAIVYHIYHPEKKNEDLEHKNRKILETAFLDKKVWTNSGMDQHKHLND